MKIRPVRAEMFQTDGRTDMTKLTVALRNFEKKFVLPEFPRSQLHD